MIGKKSTKQISFLLAASLLTSVVSTTTQAGWMDYPLKKYHEFRQSQNKYSWKKGTALSAAGIGLSAAGIGLSTDCISLGAACGKNAIEFALAVIGLLSIYYDYDDDNEQVCLAKRILRIYALTTGVGALATGAGALATGAGALATGVGALFCFKKACDNFSEKNKENTETKKESNNDFDTEFLDKVEAETPRVNSKNHEYNEKEWIKKEFYKNKVRETELSKKSPREKRQIEKEWCKRTSYII